MAAKGGLFAVASEPADDTDDYTDDALPAIDDEDGEATDPMAGPFESYCKTIFDDKADYQAKRDALREAIMTLIEEGGLGGGEPPALGGLGDL
jgi:hypothetical protein